MNRLVTRAPSRNRWALWDDDLGEIFEGFFRPMRHIEEAASRELLPAMDVTEHGHNFVVRADMPGISKEDINITLEDGLLTILAETKSDTEVKEGDRVMRQERHYGKYVRSLQLGTLIDEKKVKASYKDGVLELMLSKTEEVKPKRISVDVG